MTEAIEVLQQQRGALVRYAGSIVGSRDAEDAVQAAAIVAMRRPDVTGPTTIGWLKAVVLTKAIALKTRDLPLNEEMHELTPAPEPDLDHVLDLRAEVGAAMRTLRPDYARALALKAHGYSYEEIAKMCGCTYAQVNRRIVRGRKAARRAMS